MTLGESTHSCCGCGAPIETLLDVVEVRTLTWTSYTNYFGGRNQKNAHSMVADSGWTPYQYRNQRWASTYKRRVLERQSTVRSTTARLRVPLNNGSGNRVDSDHRSRNQNSLSDAMIGYCESPANAGLAYRQQCWGILHHYLESTTTTTTTAQAGI